MYPKLWHCHKYLHSCACKLGCCWKVLALGISEETLRSQATAMVEDMVVRVVLKLAPHDYSKPMKSQNLQFLVQFSAALQAAAKRGGSEFLAAIVLEDIHLVAALAGSPTADAMDLRNCLARFDDVLAAQEQKMSPLVLHLRDHSKGQALLSFGRRQLEAQQDTLQHNDTLMAVRSKLQALATVISKGNNEELRTLLCTIRTTLSNLPREKVSPQLAKSVEEEFGEAVRAAATAGFHTFFDAALDSLQSWLRGDTTETAKTFESPAFVDVLVPPHVLSDVAQDVQVLGELWRLIVDLLCLEVSNLRSEVGDPGVEDPRSILETRAKEVFGLLEPGKVQQWQEVIRSLDTASPDWYEHLQKQGAFDTYVKPLQQWLAAQEEKVLVDAGRFIDSLASATELGPLLLQLEVNHGKLASLPRNIQRPFLAAMCIVSDAASLNDSTGESNPEPRLQDHALKRQRLGENVAVMKAELGAWVLADMEIKCPQAVLQPEP